MTYGVDPFAKLGVPNRIEMGSTGIALILKVAELGVKWLTAQITAAAEEPEEDWIASAVAELKISNSPIANTFKSFPSGAVTIDTDYGFMKTASGEALVYVGAVNYVAIDITTAGGSAGIRAVHFGADKQR